jgi:GT2 family glycosyltransferase
MKTKIVIIVATKDRAKEVVDLFNDLLLQTFQEFIFLVMDDVSHKDEYNLLYKQTLNNYRFKLFSIPPPHKLEGDKTFNILLKSAMLFSPDYILNIHNDMKINSTNFLSQMVEYMDENENCGAVGPTIYEGNGNKTWGPGIIKCRMGREYILNECYMVRANCFIKMGFINEKLLHFGSEYYIFNWLMDNGYTTMNFDNISIIHYGGGTSSKFKIQKYYLRPRAIILIMKLFCQQVTFLKKLKIFYDEMSEPREALMMSIKKLKFLKTIKILTKFLTGTFEGLITRINFQH